MREYDKGYSVGYFDRGAELGSALEAPSSRAQYGAERLSPPRPPVILPPDLPFGFWLGAEGHWRYEG